jgi:hypothetical protein
VCRLRARCERWPPDGGRYVLAAREGGTPRRILLNHASADAPFGEFIYMIKRMVPIRRSAAILLAFSFINSGCAMYKVSQIGVRYQYLNQSIEPTAVYVATNNDIAVRVRRIGQSPTSRKPKQTFPEEQYYFLDADRMNNYLGSIPSPAKREEAVPMYLTNTPGLLWDRIRISSVTKSSDSNLPIDFPKNWKEFPDQFSAVPYKFQNTIVKLRFVTGTEIESTKSRQWYSYPCQVLLVPAFAIDVLTLPLYLIFGGFGTAE